MPVLGGRVAARQGLLQGEVSAAAPEGVTGGMGTDALEGKGPQRRPQRRLGRRSEEVVEAVGDG